MTSRKRLHKRRWVRWTAASVTLPVAIVAIWLLDHLRPRHDHFDERQGTIVEATVTREDPDNPTFHSESVTVRSDNGLTVDFRVLRPAEEGDSVPLVILLAGFRTGSKATTLIGDPGKVAIVAMDYPYQGPEKFEGVWQAISHFPEVQRGLLDTPPAVSLAVDWLVEQPWADREQAELVGASVGVPFAAVAGARDKRFKRVWLIHGGANNQDWLKGALRKKIGNDSLRGAAASALVLLAHGASFENADWVSQIAPRPVVVVGARDDESLSAENIEALFLAAGEPRELIWTDGGHVKRNRPEVVQQLLDVVRERM